MLQAVSNAFKLPDLRRKVIFTLGVLVIFRLAAHVPVPGVNLEGLRQIFAANQLLGLLDMFSGGAMSNFSVMAMGVYPYITASIVIQLLTPIIPQLQALAKEGEAGRNKMNQYTLLLTVPLAFLQAFAQASLLAGAGFAGPPVLENFGFTAATWLPTLATLLTLTAGTMFAIWLGELIDQQGIGNGISIIIFGGIVTEIPGRVGQLLITNPMALLVFAVVTALTVVGIVIVQEGQRRIPVQYAKRVRGTKVYGGQSTHIPLQVNAAGMIPLIFAVSIMILPGVVASYLVGANVAWVANVAQFVQSTFDPGGSFYWIAYFFLVIGFTYFYTDVIFQQQNLAENLQRQGGFVTGIRPGKRTAEYLNGVVQRITLVGAVFLGVVAILPFLVRPLADTGEMLVTSTGLLIVVGVVLDTMKQLEAQLLMRHYEGFIRR
jgi:preprotein translocase subunit SecY